MFCLPPAATCLIAIPSFVFLIAALTGQVDSPALVYTAYSLSAYALMISMTGIFRIVKAVKSGISEKTSVQRLFSIPAVDKLIRESTYRTEIALYPGFCINLLYAIFKTATGIYYRSAWFLSLGVYYLALAVMRFLLIHYLLGKKQEADNDKMDEWRRYRMCGYMLFLINAAIIGITILAVKKNQSFAYPGYLIYVMAMYTFYSVITAAANLVKYRKYGSPVMSAAKVIQMSTALVSLFSLESAMLVQFGQENAEHFRVLMTALTGAGISFLVVGMAMYMIIHSGSLIKKIRRNNRDYDPYTGS